MDGRQAITPEKTINLREVQSLIIQGGHLSKLTKLQMKVLMAYIASANPRSAESQISNDEISKQAGDNNHGRIRAARRMLAAVGLLIQVTCGNGRGRCAAYRVTCPKRGTETVPVYGERGTECVPLLSGKGDIRRPPLGAKRGTETVPLSTPAPSLSPPDVSPPITPSSLPPLSHPRPHPPTPQGVMSAPAGAENAGGNAANNAGRIQMRPPRHIPAGSKPHQRSNGAPQGLSLDEVINGNPAMHGHASSAGVMDSVRTHFAPSGSSREIQALAGWEFQGFPPGFATPQMRQALAEWAFHLREKDRPPTPTAWRKMLARLEKLGHDPTIEAIEYSISQGWVSIHRERADEATGDEKKQADAAAKKAANRKAMYEALDRMEARKCRETKPPT